MESLFQGRDPHAGTDAAFDALLEEALRVHRSPSSPRQPGASLQSQSPTAYIRTARAPIPPLLKAYWVVCAALLLALIQMGCDATRLASTSHVAKSPHTSLPVKLRQEPEPSLATVEPELPPAKSMTWVQEDEPAIEITGPVMVDPFADWAPKAVLEKLPAPRAQLVALPVRRAKVVRLPR
jgi:hypothetical protein